MSPDAKDIRVLFLGPTGSGTHSSDTEQQSRAIKQLGAEFVVYEGGSEGELIEALKDAERAWHLSFPSDRRLAER